MKLFVIGSTSPYPEDWAQAPDGIAFVIAQDVDEARRVAEEAADCPACEVPMDRPQMLGSFFNDALLDKLAEQD